MRSKIVLGIAAAVAVGMAEPRGARACGKGGGNYNALIALAIAGLAVGATDVGLTLWDGGSAIVSHHPSVGYGVFELIFSAPQFVLGAYAMGDAFGRGQNAAAQTVYTLWMGTLATHALWTIVTREPPPEKFSLGPTYAPVGQQTKTGFGLVARF
jgi:hypothetical protein